MSPDQVNDVFVKAKRLFEKNEIESAIERISKEITSKLSNTNPILMCVMKGGMIFTGNLMTRLNFPLEMEYVHATRYGLQTKGGELEWLVKPRISLKDRTILILDDILDGGVTLAAIKEYCKNNGAHDVYTGILIDLTNKRIEGGVATADFTALSLSDGFLFGYGIDYKEQFRNVPHIYKVAPEHQ